MKVSVIIPVRNEEDYIGNCLTDLTNQEEPADEIIVVNNGSTDKTVEIVKEFPVKLLYVKEPGIARTRALGFDEAKGDILGRIDADTKVPRNWIKKMRANFEAQTIDALTGPANFYDAPLQPILFSKFFVSFMHLIQGFNTLNGPNMAMTKSIWNRVSPHLCTDDTKMHEDLDLAIHIHRLGGVIKYDPQFIAQISARRIKHNPTSFFIEYQSRTIRTLFTHGIPFKIFKSV